MKLKRCYLVLRCDSKKFTRPEDEKLVDELLERLVKNSHQSNGKKRQRQESMSVRARGSVEMG